MSRLRRAGSIGIDTISWQREINRVSSRNDAITQRLNPTINRTSFRTLSRMLERLESINQLAVRYQTVVRSDVNRMRLVSIRMSQSQQDLSAIFRRS